MPKPLVVLTSLLVLSTGCLQDDPTALDQSDQALTGSNGISVPPIDFTVSADPATVAFVAGDPYGGGGFDLVTVGSAWGGCITVSFTATGLPSGASTSYWPATSSQLCANTTTRTHVGVSTTWSTPPGTYAMTFTAAGGGHSHSVKVSLVITAQQFAPAAWPPALNLDAGQSASAWVSMSGDLSDDNPLYAASFQLSASGLPPGVTATFSPASISYQYPYEGSTVTFTTAPGVVVPPTTVTLVATANGKSGTTTIQLGPQSQLITNGGFESGTNGWQLGGQLSRLSSTSPFGCEDPHLGAAWIEGSGNASASETFVIPADASSVSLAFWINGNTSSTSPLVVDVYDWNTGTRITLGSYAYLSLGFCSTGFIYTPYPYTRESFDLTRFRGHMVRLEFRIATATGGTAGMFALDDVSVAVTY